MCHHSVLSPFHLSPFFTKRSTCEIGNKLTVHVTCYVIFNHLHEKGADIGRSSGIIMADPDKYIRLR